MDLPQLILSCKQNELGSFEKLFQQLSPMLMTTARRYMNHDDAFDVIQDSFVQIFRAIPRFSNDIPKVAYFHRMVINNCLKQIRKRQLIKRSEEQAEHSVIHLPVSWSELNVQDILNAVKELPTVSRLCFNMYEIDGFSHKEIAEELKIKESTSRANLARAKKQLQHILKERDIHTPINKIS